jgi:cell division protein FtsB
MVVFLLFVAGLLAVAVWYLPLIKQNERMRRENLRLDGQIEKEELAGKQLRSSIEALKDPKVVERLARERLGYGKPGETIIRFETPKTSSSAR